ncbi:MAG: hypothetical protein U0Q15_02995 [Kineosporiaceae bacterium]
MSAQPPYEDQPTPAPTDIAPPRHPDRDALADHAAGVLTEADDALVADHVAGCAQCRADLEELDAVRKLLLAEDPGPMPDDVWGRIEAALLAEGSPAVSPRSTPTPLAAMRATDADEASAADGAADGAAEVSGLTVLRRPTGRAGRARTAPRWLPLMAAAAGIAGVLGGLAVAVQAWAPGGQDADKPAAASADMSLNGERGRVALAAAVQATGTDYRKASLTAQVARLVDGRDSAAFDSGDGADGKAAEGGSAGRPSPSAQAAYAAGDERLRDPAALQQCLAGLGLADVVPLAVDLARYEGRDAALLVVPTPGQSSVEVYAVSRRCGDASADDGAFSYTRIDR